jgi:beta-mannosidase
MGTVWWQLNDCWPVTSWAVIDGDGVLKPAWYALRRAYAPRLVTVQPQPSGLVVVLVNDTRDVWETTVDASRCSVAGQRLAATAVPVRVDPYAAAEVPLPEDVTSPEKPAQELICAVADGHRATWWFVEDRAAALPPASFDADVRPVPGGYAVRIAARTLVRDLCLFVDRLDPAARVDDMLITLLPGEEVELRVETTGVADPLALLTPPVLRYVNDVGVGDPEPR